MRRGLLLATTLLLAGSAVPAAAVAFNFDLTGSRNAAFSIDPAGGPDSFTAFQTFFEDVAGTYNGTPSTADISFSTSFFGGPGGGFEVINLSLLGFSQFTSTEVLFTGTTAAPVFKTGTFALSSIVSGASTLTISIADGAVIPEPATWALLVTGFGLVGTALRRRKPVAA